MPRTVEEILAHADELAARFEDYDPKPTDGLDVSAIGQLRAAIAEQSVAERHLLDAVKAAREAGMSWASIGTFVAPPAKPHVSDTEPALPDRRSRQIVAAGPRDSRVTALD